jgi:hypothetical protein
VVTKWVCRPVWEEFVRLDAYDKTVDTVVNFKVWSDDGGVVGGKTTIGAAAIRDILDYADGFLHTLQLPIIHAKKGTVVGVLHMRVRATATSEVVPKMVRKKGGDDAASQPGVGTQFALSAGAGGVAAGAAGSKGGKVSSMSSTMRRNMTSAMSAMPIPTKYVKSAAAGVRSAAFTAINKPAQKTKWAARSVKKGCKKLWYGKEKYKAKKEAKLARELEAAERAAGFVEAWKSVREPHLLGARGVGGMAAISEDGSTAAAATRRAREPSAPAPPPVDPSTLRVNGRLNHSSVREKYGAEATTPKTPPPPEKKGKKGKK